MPAVVESDIFRKVEWTLGVKCMTSDAGPKSDFLGVGEQLKDHVLEASPTTSKDLVARFQTAVTQ
jgi:hypothetical protein